METTDDHGFWRRHAVGVYFTLAFAISWAGAGLGLAPAHLRGETVAFSQLLGPGFLMISGPALAAVSLTLALDGRKGLQLMRRRMSHWRVDGRWYLALLIFPGLILATTILLSRLGIPELKPGLFLPGIGVGLVAGFVEEIGWTGFALPRLRSRRRLVAASLTLGFVHALWHLPSDCFGNANDFGSLWWPYFTGFFLFVVALRVLMSWAYDRTGSILVAQLMHASSTGSLAVLVPIGVGGAPWALFYGVYATALWGVAAVIIRVGHPVRPSDSE